MRTAFLLMQPCIQCAPCRDRNPRPLAQPRVQQTLPGAGLLVPPDRHEFPWLILRFGGSIGEYRNFSISPGNRLSTGEQRPPLMSRRCLRRPLSRDPDAVIVGAVHRCSNAPPGVIENLPAADGD